MRAHKCRFLVRKRRLRTKILSISSRPRLSIFKSCKHIYAQIIDRDDARVLCSVSTLHKDIRKLNKSNCNIDSASKLGALLANKALESGLEHVVFDRGGHKYHGVVKAFADAARSLLVF